MLFWIMLAMYGFIAIFYLYNNFAPSRRKYILPVIFALPLFQASMSQWIIQSFFPDFYIQIEDVLTRIQIPHISVSVEALETIWWLSIIWLICFSVMGIHEASHHKGKETTG